MLEGSTALSKAILAATLVSNTEVMTVLLNAGADASIKSADGKTALQHAMQLGLDQAYADGYEDSTAAFDCLLSHSSQPLPAAELVSTAWSLAGAALGNQSNRDNLPDDVVRWVDLDSMFDSDSDDEDRTAEQREAQHSMLDSLLEAAAAKDSAAAQTAITKCVKQVEDLHRRAKSCFDGFDECTCGCCIPQPINPDLIQRAHLLLRAMSEAWLASTAVDVAAQRSAVQHMLVSATASVKQMQHLQQQAEGDSMGRKEAQVALREQQLDEREQLLLRREQQVAAQGAAGCSA